ncbi:MAG: formyltransferase family protein [Brumimicrobium sp.]
MNIVFFGSIPTATSCLKKLVSLFGKQSIFVITDHGYETDEGETVFEFCKRENLNIITLDELSNSSERYDYGFSVRFNKIISKQVINKFNKGIINFHGGPLPDYRGSANHIFAILNEEKNFGPTFHFIDEGIDTGNIIATKMFEISEDDTGYTLFQKTLNTGEKVFYELIKKIASGQEIKSVPQNLSEGNTYKVKDLRKYQHINSLDLSEKELLKRLKAFYHPYKSGVILELGDEKIEMKLQR